jgi:tripartite-type tricarboxylate transporter receptor subunit TctC
MVGYLTGPAQWALCLAFIAFGLFVVDAQAEDYPTRPIRIIIPQAPGGVVEVSARILGEKLGGILGQQIVIESRPGASGMLGASIVAKATADGYTLLFCSGDLITIASLKPLVDVDVSTQLLPIAMVNGNPLLLVANAKAPFSNVKEMVVAAKASPHPLDYGTPGRGTLNDVLGQWIAIETGTKLQEIPYPGGSQAAIGVAAGDIALGVFSPPPVYPGLIDAGKIKVLAISSKDHPPYLPPGWPTLAESGLPIDVLAWQGLFAPAGTPDAIVARLDQAVRQVLQDESVSKRMNIFGMAPEYLPHTSFVERIREDTALYARIIQQAGIGTER